MAGRPLAQPLAELEHTLAALPIGDVGQVEAHVSAQFGQRPLGPGVVTRLVPAIAQLLEQEPGSRGEQDDTAVVNFVASNSVGCCEGGLTRAGAARPGMFAAR
jgi:hypothetical protein